MWWSKWPIIAQITLYGSFSFVPLHETPSNEAYNLKHIQNSNMLISCVMFCFVFVSFDMCCLTLEKWNLWIPISPLPTPLPNFKVGVILLGTKTHSGINAKLIPTLKLWGGEGETQKRYLPAITTCARSLSTGVEIPRNTTNHFPMALAA